MHVATIKILIETFVEVMPTSKFPVLPRTHSSAAGTFDSVGRGIITALTNDNTAETNSRGVIPFVFVRT